MLKSVGRHSERLSARGTTVRPLIWRNAYWVFSLLLILGTVGVLAVGGQPDPHGLGQTLDGPWRFHAGDDARWASPATADEDWDHITLVSNPAVRDGDVGIPGYLNGWHSLGHPNLDGYGWYRRRVASPQKGNVVLVGPPLVDDAYEAFWDGHPVGGVGRPFGSSDVTSTRPTLMRLPSPANGHSALLAIRAYMQPGVDRNAESGGLRTAPVLASQADGEALYRAQWRRTIAGYIVEVVEPVAMLVLALLAFVVPRIGRSAFARWTALALIISAVLRAGNAVSAWTDLLSLPTLIRQNAVILAPLAKLAWTLALNQLIDRRGRRVVSFAATAAWLLVVFGALAQNPVLDGAGRAMFAWCLAAVAFRIVRRGEHKVAAVAAVALVGITQFASDLTAWGVPSIWFPFDIGVSRSQYGYAVMLPLLAHLLFVSPLRKGAAQQTTP